MVIRCDDGRNGITCFIKIFNKEPFFKGADNYDQLEQITKVLGTEELYAYLNKYNIGLETPLERMLGQHRAVKLSSFVN
jgi:casein kinase II subunit alpha